MHRPISALPGFYPARRGMKRRVTRSAGPNPDGAKTLHADAPDQEGSMNTRVALQPVDAIDVTIVVDNFLDVLMPSTEMVRRAPLAWDWAERETLVAEHGFSLLVTVR